VTTGEQPQPAGEIRPPVFVDDSGRRHQRLRVAGWVVAVLAAAYLALFAISLVASPDVLPLSLPGVGRLLPDAGAPRINGAGHHKQRPDEVLSTRSPTPTPTPSPASTAPVGTPTVSPSPEPSSARPTGPPTTRPTVAPSTPPGRTRTPVATATPTKRRGSPTAHPTSRGTGKPTARPTRSPGGPGAVAGSAT